MAEVTVDGVTYESFNDYGCERCVAYDMPTDPDHKLCDRIHTAHGCMCAGIQWKLKSVPIEESNKIVPELHDFIKWFDEQYHLYGSEDGHPWILTHADEVETDKEDEDHTMSEVYESYLEFLDKKSKENDASINEAIKLLVSKGYEVYPK